MTDDIGHDPQFRDQFLEGVKPDPEFEAALYGSHAPAVQMREASRPLGGDARFFSGPMVRLR